MFDFISANNNNNNNYYYYFFFYEGGKTIILDIYAPCKKEHNGF